MLSEEMALSGQKKPWCSTPVFVLCRERRVPSLWTVEPGCRLRDQATSRLSLKQSSPPGDWRVLGSPLMRMPVFCAHTGGTQLLAMAPRGRRPREEPPLPCAAEGKALGGREGWADTAAGPLKPGVSRTQVFYGEFLGAKGLH